MATISLYRNKRDGSIYLRINHNQTHAERRLPVAVPEADWVNGRVVGGRNRDALNAQLFSILANAQTELISIIKSRPTRDISAVELRDLVCREVLNEERNKKETFYGVFEEFIKQQSNKGTIGVYKATYARLRAKYPQLDFEDITKDWLMEHRRDLISEGLKASSIQKHERNIRCIVNIGIDKGLTDQYAFRKFSVIKYNADARDISAEEFAKLITVELDATKAKYRDLFLLQFYLIGININDLYHVKPTDIRNGRLHYVRQKTGKQYNIKIEPEAAAIIKAHRSEIEGRWLNFFDNCTAESTRGFIHGYNSAIRKISKQLGIRQHMSSYVTRYSWATIASEDLGISIDVISKCLGHSFGLSVTSGYINSRDLQQIDSANRAVIDHVKRYCSLY